MARSSGNVHIVAPGVRILIEGKPNRFSFRRPAVFCLRAEGLKKILDPGFTTKKASGSRDGYRSSISYNIIRVATTKIRVESEPGKGTADHLADEQEEALNETRPVAEQRRKASTHDQELSESDSPKAV